MAQPADSRPSVYARLLALSFLAGAAIMTAELAAPRVGRTGSEARRTFCSCNVRF